MDQELHNGLKRLGSALDTFQEAYDRRLIDLEVKLDRPTRPEDRSDNRMVREEKALDAFVRFGKDIRASLEISSDPGGGYTETPALSDRIFQKQFDSSPMLGLVRNVEISIGSSWQEPIDMSDAEANWVGESEDRTETSAGSFGLNEIPLHEKDALVRITYRLREDSRFNIVNYVIDKVAARFGRLTNAAIVSGSGVKMPKGFLSYATSSAGDNSRADQKYQYVPSASSSGITADSILALAYSLRAPYRQNGVFVLNSDTARQIRTLKDNNGSYIWNASLASGTPDTLCGYRCVYDESMPSVESGAFPVAFADWKSAYVVVRRDGVRWLQDPYSAKPFILLYATERTGGQSSGDFDALKLLKIATS
jgi:HK97 family phage major capsid protein